MFWFIFAFLGVIALSLEQIIDKILVVNKEKTLDPLIASFFRNFAFFVIIALIVIIGIFGKLKFIYTVPIIFLGVIWIFNSLIYDYMLKNIEISRSSSISYLFPIILIPIDYLFFQEHFTTLKIISIILLILGAIVMSIKFSEKTIKSLFSWKIWFYFFIQFIIITFSLILFKKYNQLLGINEVSFYFSTWVFVIMLYIIILVATKKWKNIITTASKNYFLAKTFIAKFFDALGAILSLIAITLISISSAQAVKSLFPLIILCFALIFQKIGLNLKEDFSKKAIIPKIIGASLLIIGSILIII